LNRINDLISKKFLPDSGRFTNPPPRQRAGGALGGGLYGGRAKAPFSIRMTEGVKPLISLNRFGQLLAGFGQFQVLPGQKPVAILVKL
jgi:hypothetical protein